MDGFLNPHGFSFGNEMLFVHGRIPVEVKSINSKGKYIKRILMQHDFPLTIEGKDCTLHRN